MPQPHFRVLLPKRDTDVEPGASRLPRAAAHSRITGFYAQQVSVEDKGRLRRHAGIGECSGLRRFFFFSCIRNLIRTAGREGRVCLRQQHRTDVNYLIFISVLGLNKKSLFLEILYRNN